MTCLLEKLNTPTKFDPDSIQLEPRTSRWINRRSEEVEPIQIIGVCGICRGLCFICRNTEGKNQLNFAGWCRPTLDTTNSQ